MNLVARPYSFLLLALLLLGSVGLAQEATLPVCSFETTKGAQITWGKEVADPKLELNTDARFISDGKASLHLSGATKAYKGNKYLGVKVPIPKTDMEKRYIIFDVWTTQPKNTCAVYLRLYDSNGKRAASWTNWGRPFLSSTNRTFHLSLRIPRDGFHLEEKGNTGRPLTDIAAIEVLIGAPADNVPFDIYIDNLRLSAKKIKTFADIKAPKKLFIKTDLVRNGKGDAAIVTPAEPGFLAMAKRIADRIKAGTGADVPIKLEERFDRKDAERTHLILLGNICNNRLILPLYGLRYTWVDDAFPGGDGYVVRTVHDPWGTGKNAIVLGGSSTAGVEKAVDEFLTRVKDGKDLILDRTLHVVPGTEEIKRLLGAKRNEKYVAARMKYARHALAIGAHTGITGQVSSAGLAYGRTGDETYAELFKKLVYLMYEHRLSNPKTYGGPWGMDADFRLHTIIPAWDLVEESPAFSDEDRFKITKILFEFTEYCVPKARSCLTSKKVRFNHQTFPALGLFHAGTYYKKYYDNIEADYWLRIADAAFGLQAKAAKPLEDCNGYQWLTLYHTMEYALAKPDWVFFENGKARRAADYAIFCMDNLGYQVPYGDTGSFRCWGSEIPFLKGANWYYKDGRYGWAIEKKRKVFNWVRAGEYERKTSPVEPRDLLGAKAWPLDPLYYQTWRGEEYMPIEKTVDKVVMRASFDPQRQYLLLDGLSNGGHKHYDGNSISRITDRGRIWLSDNDYIKALPKFHNGVLIYKDGQSDTIPPFCELEAIADFEDMGFSETAVRNYAGVDWHRNILWLKEKYFLVVDEMTAQEDSEYTFNCKWHLVGRPTLTGDTLTVAQEGKRFSVATVPGLQLKLSDDYALGKNWKGYEFAEPVVRVLEQIGRAKLAKGEQFTYFNLLHATDEERPLEFTLKRVSPNAVLITGGETALAGTAMPQSTEKIGKIEVIASAYRITPDGFAFVNGAMLRVRGASLIQSDRPISVRCANGRMAIMASGRTLVDVAVAKGKPKRITVDAGMTKIDDCPDLAGLAEEIASLAKAPPFVVASVKAATPKGLPSLRQLWRYQEEIHEVLLSGNRHHPRAWDHKAAVSCAPAPLPKNIFSGKPENRIENLLDGKMNATGECVMWDVGQPVTVTIDLKDECDIARIALRAWWASSSSKKKLFQLDRAVVEASSDGFAKDVRRLGEIADKGTHENWGGKAHLPELYELKGLTASARQIRIRLTPRKGTAIYLTEVEVWGRKKGVVLTPEVLTEKGIEFTKLTCVCAADLNGDKRDEVILGTTKGAVLCLSPEGKLLWQVQAEKKVTSVCTVDFKGDGKLHVIAGSEDEKVYAIDPSGRVVWKFEIPKYKSKGCVRTVFPAHLRGGKAEQVLAGADNWNYYAIDDTGKEMWRFESVHDSTVGIATDIDGDGKDEVVCGTVYYWWPCVNPDGTRKWSYSTRTGPIVNALASGDITGDPKKEVIFGGADANLHVIGPDGKLLWKFNTADAVTDVLTFDIDGDGKDEIIASAMSFSVYAIQGDGAKVWRCELPEVVTDLALVDTDGDGRMEIAASCRNGKVYLIALNGKPVAEFAAGAPVERIAAANLRGKGRRSLILLPDDGSARAIGR
ncbi:MAG: PQQ-binding-like beta-propeller repeat protein [Planctomycetes bacterium]|nr:PQQ-binding-like beta-propeller repeat protein [Planctomycetota bacterium]